MTKLILYGHLKDSFAPEYDLDIKSPKEGILALCHIVPGFKEEFLKANYNVLVGNPAADFIDLDTEECDLNTSRDIHIMPIIEGARSEALKFVVAAIVIAASFAVTAFAPVLGEALFTAGVGMALNGLSALLAPSTKNSNSYVFSGEQTTVTQGNAIPLCYGTMYIDLVPISASISNETTGNTDENLQYGGVGGWTSISNSLANPFNTPGNSSGNLF